MKTILAISIEFIIWLVFPFPAIGQIEGKSDSIVSSGQAGRLDDLIEKSVETMEMDHDFADLAADLADLSAKPVNLNAAREDELNAIPFLTEQQRRDLLSYITTYGEIFSIYELQSIQGFDTSLIQNIRPYILISPASRVPPPTPKNLIRFGRHDLMVKYEQGFPESLGYLAADSVMGVNPKSQYPGSPQRYYFRYAYSWFDKLQIGIAGEKDPGEQFFRGAQSKGMDFYAAYFCLSNIGILKNLTIGNFRVSYGQGLTMGSGLSLGAVPGFSTNIPRATGIRSSLGMSEASYLRGLAATIKFKRLEISGFASYHPRDGTTISIDSSSSRAEEISSFATTGYHRTNLELAKRNVLTELVFGGNVNFTMSPNQQIGFKIGVTGIFYKYSAAVIPPVHPYNQFGFRGNQNMNTGIDFQLRYRGIHFFGEIGRSQNGGMAWLTGAILTPDPRVCITLIYRNYHLTYQNLFSNAFGQNSMNANERGIYTAISAAIHPKVNLSGYIDFFSFPWLKYRVDAPTHGQEFGMILGWQSSRNVLFNIRFYQKNTRSNIASEPNQILHTLGDFLTRSYRVGFEWLPGNGILLKTRIEVKEAGESSANRPYGYFVYQEAQIKVCKRLENITLRFALFDIPDYTSRIYVYEPEVLYGYSVPAWLTCGCGAA
ncbi:MAG: helix-hairpin-helix domain-containing protein [Bacteroidetes bacterium]|nr:helix-hairpin-helix domain-containing protein [Bacteroidota bacterium]